MNKKINNLIIKNDDYENKYNELNNDLNILKSMKLEYPDNEIIKETNLQLKEIEQGLMNIKELMKMTENIIVKDGENLNKIETNVESSDVLIEDLNEIIQISYNNNHTTYKVVGGVIIGGLVCGGIGSIFGIIPGLICASVGSGSGCLVGYFIQKK